MTVISLMVCGGAIFRKYRAGRIALGTGIACLAITGFFPIGQNMLVYLENQYPVPVNLPDKVDGIIVPIGT